MDLKRFTKEKSPWVKTKAKTGPEKKKSGEFGDGKKKILEESDKGSWFDQPSQIGKEKPGDEQCSTASESVVGISRKKIMGTNLPEERKVLREPLPSTSQDYSSPEISCPTFTSASLQLRVSTCSLISSFFLEVCFIFVFPIDDYCPKACVQKT